MRIAIAAERTPGETRVAVVPDLVARLVGLGYEVCLEPGAGSAAGYEDAAYATAGATPLPAALDDADVVLGVRTLSAEQVATLRPGAAVLSFLPFGDTAAVVAAARTRGVALFAMEQVPRISRAQPMDALTSQAMVAGYRAVVVAAELLPRFFPLSVTAAGTVPPAEVLVLGSGVAGLQAIATAGRLGARVSGYDVRVSSAEEIASLGATPVDLGLPPLEGAAGYARELTPERAEQQATLLAPYVARADVVITTAAVPGRTAPVLVTRSMVEAMRPGSVVVDIAVDSGGNVADVVPGEVVRIGGARVWGGVNVPAQMPAMASQLYAQNLVNLVALMTTTGAGGTAVLDPDLDDEIVTGARVC